LEYWFKGKKRIVTDIEESLQNRSFFSLQLFVNASTLPLREPTIKIGRLKTDNQTVFRRPFPLGWFDDSKFCAFFVFKYFLLE